MKTQASRDREGHSWKAVLSLDSAAGHRLIKKLDFFISLFFIIVRCEMNFRKRTILLSYIVGDDIRDAISGQQQRERARWTEDGSRLVSEALSPAPATE